MDYEDHENTYLEEQWNRQPLTSQTLQVTLPGWPLHVIHLGTRLQQVNLATGRARCIRRVQILAQGNPGGWLYRIPDEDQTSPDEDF